MWPRFLTAFAATALTALLATGATIALIDPLAISPLRIVSDDILPQTNRRYLVPAIVRGGRHDSYMVGTSSIHSLDPTRMQEVLTGRFANLSLFASTPYEQTRVVRLIVRERPQARLIVWGIDADWCSPAAARRYSPLSEFPDWLYDDDRLNDLTHALNWSSVDLARRKLQQLLRPKALRLRADGYLNMLPPDASYDVARARREIYGAAPPRKLTALAAPAVDGSAEIGAQLPGVGILGEAIAGLPQSLRLVLVLMPRHATLLPAVGSPEERALEHCKAAVAAIARARGDWLLDAMWPSVWTVEDGNFWEPHHFRDHLAEALTVGIGGAIREGRAEPAAALRILVRGR